MDLTAIRDGGLVLLGCGKMGSALLAGWLKASVAPSSVWVMEPNPSDWLTGLAAQGLHLNAGLPETPRVCLLAVKPQMMGAALPAVAALGSKGTLILSIAAGTTIARFEAVFGATARIVRSMPNTPAAIGKGITAYVGNAHATQADLALAAALLSAVGQTVALTDEAQIDAVTAVSGSGPAYVFHLIEAMEAAAMAEGLPADMARALAVATVEGAGALAAQSGEDPGQLRVNVTSPGGTTAAALAVLMDDDAGLKPLIARAVHAAAERGRELAKDT